jgi:acyl-CoA synthetase (AMP-forming)/AMP-acid ligase II
MTVRKIAGTFETAVDLMAAVVDTYPNEEAFVDGAVRLTFAEWDRAADGVAMVMADLGVGKGDVVCLLLPSSADYAIAYQAAMRLGAITSGINTRLGPGEIESIFARTEPRLIICEDPARLASPPPATVLPRAGLAAAAKADPLPRRGDLKSADPVAVVWTSGTSGAPKGAVFDHANLAAMARGAGALSEPGDRRLSPLPFAHVGYMTRVWDELVHVITTIVVPAPWKAGEALRLIGSEGVTLGQGVPSQWSLMLGHPDFDQTDVSSLRLAATGGASVPPELVRDMRRRLGCPVIVRYTSTEACVSTGSRPDDLDDVIINTVGRPEQGVEMEIVDDDGAVVPGGIVGTVRLRSGAVMRRYWKDPVRTAEAISEDGWLLTGDLGRLDDAGNLTLVGRRTDMYIRGGYNVYPTEVEAVLGAHPAVEKVAVVGVGDPVLGQIGVAFVVPASQAAPPDLDELRKWIRERLADYKAPDRLRVVDDLPLTAMSKIDKRALAAAVADVQQGS